MTKEERGREIFNKLPSEFNIAPFVLDWGKGTIDFEKLADWRDYGRIDQLLKRGLYQVGGGQAPPLTRREHLWWASHYLRLVGTHIWMSLRPK